MRIRKSESIDEIYQQVEEYDLVLTVDAPLADALNNRIEEARLGELVITPRRLVYSKSDKDLLDKKGLFLEVVERTELSWKKIVYLLDKIIDSFQKTGELEKILDYEKYDTEEVREILEVLKETDNIYKEMRDFELDFELDFKLDFELDFELDSELDSGGNSGNNSNSIGKVAVVGVSHFDELDKKVVPFESGGYEVDKISFFKGSESKSDSEGENKEENREETGKVEIPEFKVFNSASEIVESLRKNLEGLNPSDVAIVVDPSSKYQPLITSAFEAEEIPFIVQKDLSQDMEIRSFIQLLRISLDYQDIRLEEARPVLNYLGIDISREDNKKDLVSVKELYDISIGNEEEKRLIDLFEEVADFSFSQALSLFEECFDGDLENLRKVLEDLDFVEREINRENLNMIEYYFRNFDLPVEKNSKGVLFVSPKSTAFVDKAVVFYLGMDSDWDQKVGKDPWIDREEEEKANLEQFLTLIQNGSQVHYMVQDKIMNREVTPSSYLAEVCDSDFSCFTDLPFERYGSSNERKEVSFNKEELGLDSESEEVKTISQSSLNKLVKCPKDYFFSRLIDQEQRSYFKKGTLFHDFAEFYYNYRNFIKGKGRESFVELFIEEMKPFTADSRLTVLRTEIKIGLESIMKFIDGVLEEGSSQGHISSKLNISEETSWKNNFFAEKFDKPIRSSLTEKWFESEELGMKGKADLVKSEKHIVDYKSGRKKSRGSLVRKSKVDLFEDKPNFQPIMYLSWLRRRNPGEKLKFSLYNFLDNQKDFVEGEPEIEDDLVEVNYYPRSLEEAICSKEVFEWLKSSNKRKKVLNELGYSSYENFFEKFNNEEKSFDFETKDEAVDSDLLEKFVSFSKEKIGDYKYVLKGCKSVFKKLVEFKSINYFKGDLDQFEVFVKEKIEELNQYRESRFPVGDIDRENIENKDLVLEEI